MSDTRLIAALLTVALKSVKPRMTPQQMGEPRFCVPYAPNHPRRSDTNRKSWHILPSIRQSYGNP
jgi:hypothetical protein